jgi:4-amino-4-deoxy-L-arabinose transferase-like glycosyltransferase
VVAACVLLAVVLRSAYQLSPLGADEAGYLLIAGQWHAGGGSLYGHYWVDRPPLLLMLFQLAHLLGGLSALRVLGAAAAGLTVAATASAAGRLGGPAARRWSALLTAVLLSSPLLGTTTVDGELLAAPLLAGGMAAAVAALGARTPRRAAALAAGAGACALAALLVKQNMADALVFTVCCWALALRWRAVDAARLRVLVSAACGGALALGGAVAAWSVLHGTSLGGIFWATYVFRLRAAHLIATTPHPSDLVRLHKLLLSCLVSGLPLLAALLAWWTLRRRPRDPAVWALLVTIGFGAVSVLSGGSYWLHYLVQPVPALSIAAGTLLGRGDRAARACAALVAAVALGSWATVWWTATDAGAASVVGEAVGHASRPGDTVVSALGAADLVRSSGLSSPYPYLWSLPAHTLDRHLRRLRAVLEGPDAPTWIVVNGHGAEAFLRATTGHDVNRLYHDEAVLCGRHVFVREGVTRPVPRVTTSCRVPVTGSLGARLRSLG